MPKTLRLKLAEMLVDNGLDISTAASIMAAAEPEMVVYGVVPSFSVDESKVDVARAYKHVERKAYHWLLVRQPQHPLIHHFQPAIVKHPAKLAKEVTISTRM